MGGRRIGHHHRLRPVGVIVRLAPVVAVVLHRVAVGLELCVVVALRAKLHRLHRPVGPTPGIGLEPVALLGIVVGDKSHPAPMQERVVLHKPARRLEHPGGLLDVAGDNPRVVVYHHFGLRQLLAYVHGYAFHLLPHQPPHHLVDDVLGVVVQHPRRQLQQQRSSKDDSQVAVGLEEVSYLLPPVFLGIPFVRHSCRVECMFRGAKLGIYFYLRKSVLDRISCPVVILLILSAVDSASLCRWSPSPHLFPPWPLPLGPLRPLFGLPSAPLQLSTEEMPKGLRTGSVEKPSLGDNR